ncbi:MAG: phosphate regulon transcriptional regulator PhoB [Arenicellales bacterium]|jgi:two-component system phosphate regulon response regulator PhoB|nr:phosphate regulon transcriptional regulatory protein PhoB [Acidiferrobacter sp.]MEC9079172.1 phosphate regulon transcriptional regulator PhoB [Pseudomonadota bacterium]MED5532959.1 phosphate regulon transcriptional regulator PhoB [Pseudomonadota bacterium]|tara:strand:+ start:142 stop:837 length:696 start_codon:yes stop_codon:yes gene_type:complete
MGVPDILVVEDDRAIRDMLNFVLAQHRFNIIESNDAESAQQRILQKPPNLILLDWMLPGQSGIDFAQQLRADPNTRDIPIIMITAKGEEIDKVSGLNSGADDYITKPFSPRELIARIKAVLRRGAHTDDQEVVAISGLTLNRSLHQVKAHGHPLDLGPTEFKLLHFLMQHPERVYGRDQLLDRVWGRDVFVEERTVDVCVRRLRKTLEPHGFDKFVETIRGVGYRFSANPS